MSETAGPIFCFYCMTPLSVNDSACPGCGSRNSEVSNLPHQLPCGTVLEGKYLIGRVLGQGGFGITYLGLDLRLQTLVAIKEYYPNDMANRDAGDRVNVSSVSRRMEKRYEKGKYRFLAEARALAQFSHEPGIVYVRDFFDENGTSYFVMDYVEGETLKRVIKENGPLPVDVVLDIMRPILATLQKMHAAGLIHRDIAPDNIMLRPGGTAVLIDFGAAKSVSLHSSRTLSGVIKRGYSPPEQYSTSGDQGPWTDIYALCATIYKITTGITPPESLARQSDVIRKKNDPLVSPTEFGAQFNRAQECALMRGLSVDAEDRQQDVEELQKGLYAESRTVALGRRLKRAIQYITAAVADPDVSRRLLLGVIGSLAVAILIFVFNIQPRDNKPPTQQSPSPGFASAAAEASPLVSTPIPTAEPTPVPAQEEDPDPPTTTPAPAQEEDPDPPTPSPTPTPKPPTPTPEPVRDYVLGQVSSRKANLRSKRDFTCKVIAVLREGVELEIYDLYQGFYKVKAIDLDIVGYIYAYDNLITIDGHVQNSGGIVPTPTPTPRTTPTPDSKVTPTPSASPSGEIQGWTVITPTPTIGIP